MVFWMEFCKAPPPSAVAPRKKAEETLRPPLAPSEKTNAAPVQRKPSTREVTSRYKSRINPLAFPSSSTSATPQRCPSPIIRRPALSPTPPSPKRSQSAERRRAPAPCSPSRAFSSSSPSSKASTPVHDVIREMQLSSRGSSLGRTADGLWPSLRSLAGSFLSERISSIKHCRDLPQGYLRGISPARRAHVSTSDASVSVYSSERSPSSTRPSRALSVPLGRSSCPSPASKPPSPSSSSRRRESSVASYFASRPKEKRSAGHVEDTHQLRMLENRYLQWRFVNARAHAAMNVQRITAKKVIFNARARTSEIRCSLVEKRTRASQQAHELKAERILRAQAKYLEEWASLEDEHTGSLGGAMEALKSCTLRLPLIEGARADVNRMKDAIRSAVAAMQPICSSISQFSSEVEAASSVAADLAATLAAERALLLDCRELLSRMAQMQVKQSSLMAHLMQAIGPSGPIMGARPSP